MLFRRRNPLSARERIRGFLWPSNGWKRSARYVGKRVLRLSGSPHAIAAGFAAGVFASFTPFIGFHFLIGFALAFLLGGNMVASAFGTAIGNPLTFPLIWLSTYEAGAFILGHHGNSAGHGAAVDLSGQSLGGIGPLLAPMTVGSIPLGIGFAAISYFLVRGAVIAYQGARRRRLEARRAPIGLPANGGSR